MDDLASSGPDAGIDAFTDAFTDAYDEKKAVLNGVFAETLGLRRVANDRSFFDLGGHSLLATRLITKIRERVGTDVSLLTVFECPTVDLLAAQLVLDDGRSARPPLRRMSRPDEIPLSPAQVRLWFLNRLPGPNGHYNMPMAYRVRGPLDIAALGSALGDVVARHEVLRTAYPDWDGRPQQIVLDVADAHPGLTVTAADPDRLEDLLAEEGAYRFDVTAETPLRARLFELAPDDHVLSLVVHHIACDGWSLLPLTRDLGQAYAGRQRGEPLTDDLEVQYADFALWQHELLADQRDERALLDRQMDYWRRQLADHPGVRPLDGMLPRPPTPTHRGTERLGHMPATAHAAILELAGATGASPFMIVHAAVTALLARHGAGDDVVIGTPAAGRSDSKLDDLIGFFVNTLVLRVRTDGDPTFVELLSRVRTADLAAFAHQDVPFDHLVHDLNPARTGSWQPVFNVMLAYQNNAPAEFSLAGTEVTAVRVPSAVARFDLRIEFVERMTPERRPDGIDWTITWAVDVVPDQVADTLIDELQAILVDVCARPDRPLSRVLAVDAEEPVTADVEDGTGRAGNGGRRAAREQPSLAFVCSPFGQQWVGMGRTMFHEEPIFRDVLVAYDAELAIHAGWSLVEELFLDEPRSRIHDVSVGQPLVFALQVAMSSWLEAAGVAPAAVAGHSLGEIAACVVAGIIDLSDAARLVFHYSGQQRRLTGHGGGMLVAEISAAEVRRYLEEHARAATIATENGPRTTALAGQQHELQEIMEDLRARDVLCAMIRVDLPAHSASIDPIIPDLVRLTAGITARPGRIPMISSVTGRLLDWRDVGPAYFATNLRQPVLLADATREVLAAGHDALVEISANPILAPALAQSVAAHGSDAEVLTTMRRNDSDDRVGLVRLVQQRA